MDITEWEKFTKLSPEEDPGKLKEVVNLHYFKGHTLLWAILLLWEGRKWVTYWINRGVKKKGPSVFHLSIIHCTR